MFKKLIAKLFKSEKTVVSVKSTPTKKSYPPMFERNDRPTRDGLGHNRMNGNRHRSVNIARNNIGRSASTHREIRSVRDHRDSCNAEELLRDGYLKIGLAGFNDRGFTISSFARSTDTNLASQIADLPTQIKMVSRHDIAAGLQVALQMLSRSPEGRTAIVVLTSDEATQVTNTARQLVEMAAKWKTAVHIIQMGNNSADSARAGTLTSLSTHSTLGYGDFCRVTPHDELIEVLRNKLKGLTPARSMKGINSILFLVDCSERMVELFGDSTRIEHVISALQQYLCHPFLHLTENRLPLAA